MTDFIQLNRRFAEVPKDQSDASRLEELEHLALFARREVGLDWNDLLKRNRVVILGAAGSGKSESLY